MAHREAWGEPEAVVRAPGRVNLIGEHTDYNDGFVFPMALPFDTVIAVSSAPAGTPSEIRSEGFGRFEIDGEVPAWAVYIQTMVELLREHGVDAPPWRGTVASDIPTGASLSSSAAIEVATGLAIAEQAGVALDGVIIARLGQQVETRLLGVPTGIMDQLISATAVAGSANLIDCRTLETTPHPIPSGSTVVIMDTMTRRELVDSEFAERTSTCQRAAELLGVDALRDANADAVAALEAEHPTEWMRAAHVVAEDVRTLAAAEAMAAGDAVRLGELMTASHDSLRDLYEVSSEALDQIVEVARSAPGCHGARMTGGGFAGCAVALVATNDVARFTADIAARFETWAGETPRLWPCEAASGASVELLQPS